MIRAPTPENEDRRRLCRERKTLKVERVQHVNRIKGLLFSQGVSGYEPLRRNRRQRLDGLKTGDGRPLPPHLKGQSGRELDRLELLLGQIKAVEAERDALLTPATETEGMPAPQAMLIDLRGIGEEFAAVVWSEGLCRSFANRRQVAAYGGLAPTPWQSGSVAREQGVSKPQGPTEVCSCATESHTPLTRTSPCEVHRIEALPKVVRDIGWKAQVRLCTRYHRLRARGKTANVVNVAIAREMVGFIWSIACIQSAPRAA